MDLCWICETHISLSLRWKNGFTTSEWLMSFNLFSFPLRLAFLCSSCCSGCISSFLHYNYVFTDATKIYNHSTWFTRTFTKSQQPKPQERLHFLYIWRVDKYSTRHIHSNLPHFCAHKPFHGLMASISFPPQTGQPRFFCNLRSSYYYIVHIFLQTCTNKKQTRKLQPFARGPSPAQSSAMTRLDGVCWDTISNMAFRLFEPNIPPNHMS